MERKRDSSNQPSRPRIVIIKEGGEFGSLLYLMSMLVVLPLMVYFVLRLLMGGE